MNLKTMKRLFKNAVVSDKPYDESYLSLSVEGSYFNIRKDEISERELLILSQFEDKKIESSLYDHLHLEKEYLGFDIDKIQAIFFKVDKVLDDRDEFIENFGAFFTGLIDSYYLSDYEGVILLKDSITDYEILLSFINILEDDFACSINVYIGTYREFNRYKKYYDEECQLAKVSYMLKKIGTYKDVFTEKYLIKSLEESEYATYLKEVLLSQAEIKELIISLYKNQGNQSKVAKEIYVHRNTIVYRLDKLMEDYNLNLRDVDQLLLSYLLVK